MSGEGGPIPNGNVGHRILAEPSPAEAQALADNLRDMLAADALDARIVRQAANALEAVALLGRDAALLADFTPQPAPFDGDQ